MAESTQWRVYITANNGQANFTGVAELEMAEEEGGDNICSGGTILFSSEHGSFNSPLAFDGNKAAYGWITASGQKAPCFIGYEFASPVQIQEFRIWANEAGLAGVGSNPRDFTLQYHDGDAWVDTEAVYINETGWSNYELRTYVGDLSASTYSTVSGRCVRGVAQLPAQRELYAYRMLDGEYCGYGETDEYGNFEFTVTTDLEIFLRVVDPEGIYSTEIRENITPTAVVIE